MLPDVIFELKAPRYSARKKNRQSSTGLHPWCKYCRNQSRKDLYARDPDRANAQGVWRSLKWRHGITRQEYQALSDAQSGCCAICGEPSPTRRLAVDHDHKCCPSNRQSCGECKRGLLCTKCNTLLGLVSDEPERLEKAIRYLRKWSK